MSTQETQATAMQLAEAAGHQANQITSARTASAKSRRASSRCRATRPSRPTWHNARW
jgi:hypothetical protein